VESFVAFLADLWQVVAAFLTVLLSVIASVHVVLYKRDSRAAVAWVGVIWLAPVVGPVLYVLLGINRIRRHAAGQRQQSPFVSSGEFLRPARPAPSVTLPSTHGHLGTLAQLVDRVAGRPLLAGNAVSPLVDGDEAFPAMLDAIDRAALSVALSTYIFDHDFAGRLFVDALARAVTRGVAVRVLIDTVGARYSRPSIVHALERRAVRVARYGRTLVPWRMPYVNLRNHRKILVVDGREGFTGGINIREGCLLARRPRHPVQDLHFRLNGPVVAQLMETFVEDWAYTTGEQLDGASWFPQPDVTGPVFARGINDGPDEDFEKARFVFLGALACAQERVRIVTPYFVPDQGLITALDVAALRGVRVDIVVPQRSNLAFVQWAATAQLWQVLHHGCRVYATPPPFDHSKLMLVDGGWALFGSTNWDARSLRLNFEFGVECYDEALVTRLDALVDRKLAGAREVTARDVNARPLPVKLRDGIVRLAAPYL
jgi:cardiolipin synthase